jgi:hypothetical protein
MVDVRGDSIERLTVINEQLAGRGTYLELGVRGGATFWKIKARTRIGVDPAFLGRKLAAAVKLSALKRAAGVRSGTMLYPETSDAFFRRHRAIANWRFDCVFIDGLHTAGQAYRDADNALQSLATGGLVVMHDCNPQTETAGLPSAEQARRRPDYRGVWQGTVWQAIVKLRTRSDLTVQVLDADYGLGLVTRVPTVSPLALSDAQIAALTYSDLAEHRAELLNLTTI